MKRARFLYAGRIHHGTVTDEGQLLDEAGRRHDDGAVTWLPPVAPPKVIGLALNYADHAAELELTTPEAPALFLKPLTSLLGHRLPVVAPPAIEYMHYEAELAVAIGRPGRKIRRADAYEYVKGYTIANDVTIRDFVQNLYRPPVKAKGFDTFTPVGPWLVDRDDLPDPDNVGLRTFVNGELRQEGNTRDFVNDIPAIIEYLSDFMTLEEDDLILTGTPKGLSHIYPGDLVRIEVDGIGALENPIVAEGG
jgi:5-oxopent-3-ene-1,2,5-tricarboxylate decarboxylase/2-hydroxyhepta-2,4-diene-1,7-dioate isomerase